MNYSATELKPDFYVWLGDSAGHDVWNQSKADHLDAVRDITARLKKHGYNKQGSVYSVLGNHEGYPCDSFDLNNDTHSWVLRESAEAWKPWLSNGGNINHLNNTH